MHALLRVLRMTKTSAVASVSAMALDVGTLYASSALEHSVSATNFLLWTSKC